MLKVREAFFNFLFHVVNDCSKRTGGRATNSKVKTQKSFSSRRKKEKRKAKNRASGEIGTRKYHAQVKRLNYSATCAFAWLCRANCSSPDSIFECLSKKKKKKRCLWLCSSLRPLGSQAAALTTELWDQHVSVMLLTEPGPISLKVNHPFSFQKLAFWTRSNRTAGRR